jgi:hypothetical protein
VPRLKNVRRRRERQRAFDHVAQPYTLPRQEWASSAARASGVDHWRLALLRELADEVACQHRDASGRSRSGRTKIGTICRR